MQIKINETLRSYIEPLTQAEYAALEQSILQEGCRDALVLWQDVLVDGITATRSASSTASCSRSRKTPASVIWKMSNCG
jgi:hypothetical protein